MDMQTPDHSISPTLSRSFRTCLLRAIAGTVPADPSDDQAARDAKIAAVAELLDALDPADAADAQLAAIAIAAALAAMDGFTRAAKAGVSNETAIRLRGNALAAGRAYATARQTLRKPAVEAVAVTEASPVVTPPEPAAAPEQSRDEFQPRDRFGKPIPRFRTDLMTRNQLFATIAWPRDPALEAAAIAEEDAMIAEQAAMETGENAAAADVGAGDG
jgi:hypothetical protein